MSKKYNTVFLLEDNESDSEELTKVLNTYAEDGFVLHSIVPFLDEGTTTGYTIVFELEVDDN